MSGALKTGQRVFLGWMTAAIFAAALLVPASDTAASWRCLYSDHTVDNGPCLTVINQNWRDDIGSREMNLWCHSGPTSRSHKIILQPDDRFVCRGSGTSTTVTVQRTQAGCNYCEITVDCQKRSLLTLRNHPVEGEKFIESGCE